LPETVLTRAISFFNKDNFLGLCDKLSREDGELRLIIQTHGYPPMWTRSNSFESLILIILEQQVSLQSAKAAFLKLNQKLGHITPQGLLTLSDEEMRACYFSRQKTRYARDLAETILSGRLDLEKLSICSDDHIRKILKQVKGIGEWTADIYLLFALQRTDIFPVGDLAMINALKEIKKLKKDTSRENIIRVANNWKPYRSIATMLLWHHYIQTRTVNVKRRI
jgi:DNA-3-methyladenine glycosylase II